MMGENYQREGGSFVMMEERYQREEWLCCHDGREIQMKYKRNWWLCCHKGGERNTTERAQLIDQETERAREREAARFKETDRE